MADDAFASLSVSILNDMSKSGLSGSLNYVKKIAGDKWIYTERFISTASDELIKAGYPYNYVKLGIDDAAATVATGDKYRWLAIKNTGTTDGDSEATQEGVVISLAGAAAFDEVEGVFIGPGELWTGKFPSQTTQANIHARTVVITNGVPSANGTGLVCCQIAAIFEDIS